MKFVIGLYYGHVIFNDLLSCSKNAVLESAVLIFYSLHFNSL
jgi:hypothetical protein